jgi:tRNAThr (cytosine32-N3)-methyltransferase
MSSAPVVEAPAAPAPPATDAAEELPAHRSHDPRTNQKRTDPFQFGSRFLEAGDDVFEFNAWDHVETDDAYKEYAERQFEMQRQSPVSEFDKSSCPPISFLSFLPCPRFMMIHQSMHSSSDTT